MEHSTYPPETLKRNFNLHVLDGVFAFVAFCFTDPSTMLPAFVSKLTGSAFIIGLLPAIMSLGWLMPQIYSAYFTESMGLRKPFVMIFGTGQRLPWFFIFLAAVLFGKSNPGLTLAIFIVLFAVYAVSSGFVTPAWMDFVAKTVPVNRRGRLFSLRVFLGGVFSVFAGLLIKQILSRYQFPLNYGVCFLLCAAAYFISFAAIAYIKELPDPVVKRHGSFRDYFKKVPSIIKENRNYRNYITSKILLSFISVPAAFFMVYGIRKFGARDTDVANFILMSLLTRSFTALLCGYIADKKGHILTLRIGYLFAIAAALAAAFADSLNSFYLVFMLQGIYFGSLSTSDFSVVLEFCQPSERPTYIGIQNIVLFPFATLLPMMAGACLQYKFVNYPVLFLVSSCFVLAGWIFLSAKVKEPRFHYGK